MILYSVILPWHKDDDLFRRAVASVPCREDVELIAVEDKDRLGAGWARNQALSKARGKWLVFLDSDDFFTADAFAVMDRHASDEADVIYFNVEAQMAGSGLPSSRQDDKRKHLAAYASKPSALEFFCRYQYPEPWGKMVRRSFVEKEGIRFDQTSCANDYMFSVLCGIKASTVIYDPGVLYVVTEREGSVSREYFDSMVKLRDRLDVYWRVQQAFDRAGVRLYPFAGLWMMCRRQGGEVLSAAREFCGAKGISAWQLWLMCTKRVIMKRLQCLR